MLNTLLGPLKPYLEGEDTEMGDDSVMESAEKDGENKEGQEGENVKSENKEGPGDTEKETDTKKTQKGNTSAADKEEKADSIAEPEK